MRGVSNRRILGGVSCLANVKLLWNLATMCEPSSLISAIHRNLPYFTDNPFRGANLTNATITVENILEDVLRAGVWSGIIFAVLLLFMILTWIYCCCACVFCCRGDKKSAILKVLLGVVTTAIIVVCMLILFTAFWAETSLHNGLVSQIESVSMFIGNFTDSSTSSVVDNIVLLVEDRRHLAFIIYLVVLLFFLIVVFIVLILAPVCKSGIGVIVVVVLIGIDTVLIHAPLSIFMFGVLVIYSDVCVALFGELCNVLDLNLDPGIFSLFVSSLDVFCNNAVQSGFILFLLGVALTLLFILIQIFGIAYALSFFGSDSGSFSPNEPVSMRGTNIWRNSDEVAEQDNTFSSFKPELPNKKVEEDKVVLVQMTDVGRDDGYN